MQDKETVYRIRYTADNRVKAVHASQEPRQDERERTFTAWLVVAAGVVLCVGWWLLWV